MGYTETRLEPSLTPTPPVMSAESPTLSQEDVQKLQERAAVLMEERKQQIQDFAEEQPDHPFALANQHMLELSAQNSWNAAGVLSMTGALWWALNLSVDLAYPHVVIFNATGGPDFDFALFTSSVAGYFYVDPSTLHGKYQFTMEAVAGGVGEVSISLYDMNWGQVAYFLGAVAGLSVSNISGTGTIEYK